jgi:hypothetical protein
MTRCVHQHGNQVGTPACLPPPSSPCGLRSSCLALAGGHTRTRTPCPPRSNTNSPNSTSNPTSCISTARPRWRGLIDLGEPALLPLCDHLDHPDHLHRKRAQRAVEGITRRRFGSTARPGRRARSNAGRRGGQRSVTTRRLSRLPAARRSRGCATGAHRGPRDVMTTVAHRPQPRPPPPRHAPRSRWGRAGRGARWLA